MTLITVEYLHRIDACCVHDYATQRERDLVSRIPPEGVSPLDVAKCEDVRAADRVWLLARTDFIPAARLRLLACRWAARALRVTGEKDKRMWRLVRVTAKRAVGLASAQEHCRARTEAMAYAKTEARTEAAAYARTAAVAAAMRPSGTCAMDAARNTAWDAARTAAWATAGNAAKIAAWDRMAREVQREIERGVPSRRRLAKGR